MWIIWEQKQNSRWRTNGTWPRPEEEEGSQFGVSVLFVYKFTVPSSTFIMAPIGNQFFQMAYVLFETFAQQQRKIHSVQCIAVAGAGGLIEDRNNNSQPSTDWLMFSISLFPPAFISSFLFAPLFYTLGREKSSLVISGSRNIVTVVQPPIRVNNSTSVGGWVVGGCL